MSGRAGFVCNFSSEGVVLVDGARLAALMIEHGVGVSVRALKVPRLDSDDFDEDVR